MHPFYITKKQFGESIKAQKLGPACFDLPRKRIIIWCSNLQTTITGYPKSSELAPHFVLVSNKSKCSLHHLLGPSGHRETRASAPNAPSPLEILKRRFALGEISREQFEEMVRVLGAAESNSALARHQEHS